jgi:hypothetical protein
MAERCELASINLSYFRFSMLQTAKALGERAAASAAKQQPVEEVLMGFQ